jgi:hypothetical protein
MVFLIEMDEKFEILKNEIERIRQQFIMVVQGKEWTTLNSPKSFFKEFKECIGRSLKRDAISYSIPSGH